jgi:hypothetical protein
MPLEQPSPFSSSIKLWLNASLGPVLTLASITGSYGSRILCQYQHYLIKLLGLSQELELKKNDNVVVVALAFAVGDKEQYKCPYPYPNTPISIPLRIIDDGLIFLKSDTVAVIEMNDMDILEQAMRTLNQ